MIGFISIVAGFLALIFGHGLAGVLVVLGFVVLMALAMPKK